MYIFACIVLLNAFGFIDYKQVNKRDFDNIIIGEMNPTLKSQFRLHFDQTDNATKTRENIIKYFKELGNSTSDSDQRQ